MIPIFFHLGSNSQTTNKMLNSFCNYEEPLSCLLLKYFHFYKNYKQKTLKFWDRSAEIALKFWKKCAEFHRISFSALSQFQRIQRIYYRKRRWHFNPSSQFVTQTCSAKHLFYILCLKYYLINKTFPTKLSSCKTLRNS